MPLFDKPLAELRTYRPERDEQPDFDAFWTRTLTEAAAHPLDPEFRPHDAAMRLVDTYDVRYSGWGGHRIAGWFLVPAGATDPLPTVVQYLGYGGGRGMPHDWLPFANAGHAVFVMDTRGQGSDNTPGDTPDPVGGANPQTPGFMTRGVLDPDDYYYRRVITDAVRAVDAATTHPLVDPDRIIVAGSSQGGGITQAVTALRQGLRAAMIDVPFLTGFRRATRDRRHRPLQRDHQIPVHPPRPRRTRVHHPLVLRRHELRRTRHRTRALQRRPHGHHLPTVHSVRVVQPLRGPQGNPRLALQRTRRRRHVPNPRTPTLATHDPGNRIVTPG